MLLPYDLRPDREGWTVFEVTTDKPAFFEEPPGPIVLVDDSRKGRVLCGRKGVICPEARLYGSDQYAPARARVALAPVGRG
jgi:hypothetical protein